MNRRGLLKALGLGAAALSMPPGSLLAAGKPVYTDALVGDGITDCTRALQMALDSGANVVLRPGVYRITSQLKFSEKSGCIMGSGPRTVIRYKEVA